MMTLDSLSRTVDDLVKALLVEMHKQGLTTLTEEEIEKVESILIGAMARSGFLGDK